MRLRPSLSKTRKTYHLIGRDRRKKRCGPFFHNTVRPIVLRSRSGKQSYHEGSDRPHTHTHLLIRPISLTYLRQRRASRRWCGVSSLVSRITRPRGSFIEPLTRFFHHRVTEITEKAGKISLSRQVLDPMRSTDCFGMGCVACSVFVFLCDLCASVVKNWG